MPRNFRPHFYAQHFPPLFKTRFYLCFFPQVVDFVAPYFDQSGISIIIRKPVRPRSLFKFMEVLRVEVSLQCACCFTHALHPTGPCTSPDTPPGRPVSKVPQEDRRRQAREPPIYVYQRHLY